MLYITTLEQLKLLAANKPLLKIYPLKNSGACINMLYTLEGAIQGIRWHRSNKKKQELKAFYHLMTN